MRQISKAEVAPIEDISAMWIGIEDNDNARWRICLEELGWIFRHSKGARYGYSGHKPTRRESVWQAIWTAKAVYEFESEAQLDAWVAEVPMKWVE